jgi:hypothetical protein
MGFVKKIGQAVGMVPDDPTPPPDMTAAAKATEDASKNAALFNTQLNRVNQVGPSGSVMWSQVPGAAGTPGTWTQTTALSADQQKLYDQDQRISQGMADETGAGLGRVQASLATPMSSYGNDASRRRVEEALYSRMQPKFDQQEAGLRNRLLNSGIEVGSEAYNREMNNFNQALNDARMQTVLAGGQEENRQFGLESSARSQPLNELNALRTGSQVTPQSFGNYYTGGAAQGGNYLQAAGQQANANSIYDTGMAVQQSAYGKMIGQGANALKMAYGQPPSGNWGG